MVCCDKDHISKNWVCNGIMEYRKNTCTVRECICMYLYMFSSLLWVEANWLEFGFFGE